MKGEYLDVYAGVRSEIVYATKVDKNSDLGTAYLGKVNISRSDKIKTEEKMSNIKTGLYIGKIIRWCRVSNTFGLWSKQIIYVQNTLFQM